MKALIKSRKAQIFVFEAIGTLLLSYGVSCSSVHAGHDFIVASSLFLGLAFCGEITGGHLNPVITLATRIDKRHRQFTIYVLAQFIGAILGVSLSYGLVGQSKAPYHQENLSFNELKFILNDFIGSFMFAVCVLTLTNKYTSHAQKAWQLYLSVALALYLVRKVTGDTTVNPAVALTYQIASAIEEKDIMIFVNGWHLVVPSMIGGALGGYFTKRIYQPLLLSIKYKELGQQKKSEILEEDQD